MPDIALCLRDTEKNVETGSTLHNLCNISVGNDVENQVGDGEINMETNCPKNVSAASIQVAEDGIEASGVQEVNLSTEVKPPGLSMQHTVIPVICLILRRVVLTATSAHLFFRSERCFQAKKRF